MRSPGATSARRRPSTIDLPEVAPRLVVGGFLSPDGPVEIRVGRSVGLLAPSDTAGAHTLARTLRAALYDENGRFLDSLRAIAGPGGAYPLFRSSVVPVPGRRYELRASAAGLPSVRAIAEIPAPVPLRLRREADAPDGRARVTLAWDDPPGPAVYQITIARIGDNTSGPLSFASSDPVLRTSYERLDATSDADPTADGGVRYFIRAVFRDASFDGRAHESNLLVGSNQGDDPELFAIVLSVVSPDYARYQQAIEVQRATSGNPFVQPTEAFSNVEGGLGAFVGFASTTAVAH